LYSREWTQVEGIYLAKGGEKYLEIGSNPQKHTSEIEVPYYYMDDVMIVPIEVGTQSPILTTVNCSNLVTDPSFEKAFIKKNNTYTLENILFETNKSILLPSSFVSLDSLVALLKREKLKHIELHGHTDNEGNDAQNQRLSEARAQAVANYLRSKGIDNQRVRSKGFGATRPVETNDTPEGRLKNRRVEFVLYFP
jgi:OmpA-OmpF porin, OOP family